MSLDQNELEQGLAQYIDHLRKVATTFNDWAAHRGVPVQMDPTTAIETVSRGAGLARVAPFWNRVDDTGIVHDSQLKTAIDCMVKLLGNQAKCGHVLGAMQSGKTTTSLVLQWAGPVLYLLKGIRAYPFYIIGNQTNHEDQTQTELKQFLAYYGDVEIKPTSAVTPADNLDALFTLSPSLTNYREHVLRDVAAQDFCPVPQLEDMVHRRRGGAQGVKEIADLCRRATSAGYRPLMLIDEPQFGASDHLVDGDDGKVRRPCVLEQIFDRIEQEGDITRLEHWFVGLSATPFELNDLSRVWEVRQYLSPNYSGFNFFNGRPISEGVAITPPTTMGLTDFAESVGVPFMSSVSMSAYAGRAATFERHARKIGFTGDHAEYQEAVENALREAILAVIEGQDGDEPIGLCIRAFNDNTRTRDLIEALNLDPNKVDIVEYFGHLAEKASVKRVIGRRSRPFVVFVTNRARMADAFPVQVRFFMDFAQKAADLNSLLQGLLGRACGYGKKSTVVLSDANAGIVDAYVATQGGYVHKTSRHSIPVGGFRRGAPTSMIKLRIEMEDPKVRDFFSRLTAEVVNQEIPQGSEKLSPRRRRGDDGFRTAPILRIAQEIGLFEHLERPEVRTTLFPQIPTGFKVARADAEIKHPRRPGVTLRYHLDANGDCRYTFRWAERDDAAQGGAQGRAQGKKDSGQHMEPTVYIEKFEPETGQILPKGGEQPGNWQAFMVTFPLMEPVRELESAKVAYPKATCVYNNWMTTDEQTARDAEVAGKNQAA